MTQVDIRKLVVHTDERGWLVEILREKHTDGKISGQFYVTAAKPGISKGNHYHTRKTEWFCVISGKAKLVLKDLKTNKVDEIAMGDENMVVVKIPPNIAHSIKNIGKNDMMLLAFIDEEFDPDDPDTIPHELIK